MWISFQHKKNVHRYMSAFREKERIHLSDAELKLISTGGQPANKIVLGSRDVAVGFEVRDDKKLQNMWLVFGDESSQPLPPDSYIVSKCRVNLFLLRRLIEGKNYLEDWDKNPYSGYIVYDVSYEVNTLDFETRKRKRM